MSWLTEDDLATSNADLLKKLSYPPSKDHDPKLAKVEDEILEHWKDFSHFCNYVADKDPDAGKRFYDLDEANYFDLMGAVTRPGFRPHYDRITPYLARANLRIKDLEIIAITPECGYATAHQNYYGTAADGEPFNLTYRTTSVMRKVDGVWKYVHEHYSFPTNMATGKSDFTSGLQVQENMSLKEGETV
ncbi:hypothetical protein Z517_07831 [Fonsecaea pedrosoi CBS 271.37]|uniref:SnoaL-like domain-containing protein n=1 Tax=Fonsecaea pedrosoi CBS 271.37 TaxID=1442368 RepID=A0A0D2GBL7_9EURO|nr:uncharacterized protein Z517_07831 [Fonsecaea pedrosoi CBS 271.37]KIW77998.1 hypothetical protein Z517_07831 [Fonsecaea pedrosoi CBS 271.37]